MSVSRRQFITTGSLAVAALSLPRRVVEASEPHATVLLSEATDFKAIADAALSAATAAGAAYADIHFRGARFEQVARLDRESESKDDRNPLYTLEVSFGVRALVNGYWGHAGFEGIITPAIAKTMGVDAVGQAKFAAKGKTRTVELAKTPAVNGTWQMPVEIDPFTVSYKEKYDFMVTVNDEVSRLLPGDRLGSVRSGRRGGYTFEFMKEERAFASTEGSLTTQVTYWAQSGVGYGVPSDWQSGLHATRTGDVISVAAAGWEYIRSAPYREHALRLYEQARIARRPKPVVIGRYDVVFDAKSIARIMDQTIGSATELDRAMGYYADTTGTSYLDKPLEMLGTFNVGSPLLTVTTNRSMPNGASTVKWDDEGVEPTEATLVKNGILTDYQTTRETASWLAPYYEKTGRPVRSNGCACSFGADPVRGRLPNLTLQPGPGDANFDDLVKQVKKGFAVVNCDSSMDFQVLNGTGKGEITFEVENGKILGAVSGAELMYRAPEFWKNLGALGGKNSVQHIGFLRDENAFENQRTTHTISAVPALMSNVTVLEERRWY